MAKVKLVGKVLGVMLMLAVICVLAGPRGLCSADKKLIYYGHDMPTPSYAREHYQEMDQAPLDGTAILLGRGADRPHAGTPWDNLSWGCWGNRYFRMQDLQHHVADLQAARFERLVNNFILMTVVPGDVDWFDDFAPIVSNFGLAAGIAKQVEHCQGILLDTEAYGENMWDYNSNYGRRQYVDVYSYDDYAAQARLRGRQIMGAMQEQYPGLTVFIPHSYTLVWLNWMRDPSRVKEPAWAYTLLTPFLDGLHDVAGEGVTIVDGREIAYRYKTRGEFQQAYHEGSEEVLAMVGNPAAYERLNSLGFGLFLESPVTPGDYASWAPGDPSTHHFSPAEWEQSLRYALEICDEYVWIYTQKVGWGWGRVPERMPDEFYEATLAARQAMGMQ